MKKLDNEIRIDFIGCVATVSDEQRPKVEGLLKECGCYGEWSVGARWPVPFGRDDLEGEVAEWVLQVNQEDVVKIQEALDKNADR